LSTAASHALQAGRVGRAHGLDGSFYVTGAQPRLLSLGTKVTVAERTLAIVRLAGVQKRPIVRLQGVEDRSAAETLRGMALMVDRRDAPALAEGEWWAHELVGCAVFDGPRRVGIVTNMLELPSCEVLQVRREGGAERDGGELLVPMVKDAIRDMDVARRRVEVNLGFLGEPET
jgi:16S rRNA processing protein RimM